MPPRRHLALFVTGVPGSGKSTVAAALASGLPTFALLQKDVIKETLFEVSPPAQRQDPELSRQLSDASTRLLWSLAPGCPRLIVEANFRTSNPAERNRFQELDAVKLEVHCRCPAELAIQRFARRAASRHPAHTLRHLTPEILAEFDQPFALSPVLELDTSLPLRIASVLRQVLAHWPECEH